MVGLRIVDGHHDVLEVTDYYQENRTRDTFGVKGLGLEYFRQKELTPPPHPVIGNRDLFGGSEFAGNPKITKTVDQTEAVRTVKVTSKNGDPIRYLRFMGNEAAEKGSFSLGAVC